LNKKNAARQYNAGMLDNELCRTARIMQIMKYPQPTTRNLVKSNIECLIFAIAPFIASH